ncbi:molybdopterin-dependent oxidoreductase [Mucilaginibacter jinjuensis]|uniref:Molybdopterin-dependent oxidoreductase n=1 Tax=Mucilaginibacter jinjuensis TaxID=1176721 RepID=A0ABY7T0P5_9SPHI|nr:molybdopterin-dependent oxidoreductase [Mucilaginibacter jinjuensis]WCT10010.1 molybdopterin-dependent oxidoreductase [Mucilaginibacter jinjuensis]
MKNINFFTLVFAFTFIGLMAKAQTAEVAIGGDVTQPYKLNATNFAAMKQVTVKVTANDGREHVYSGVSLYDILTQADAIPNKQLRGKSLTKYVLVSAADGYQVVIALPEVDPAFTDKLIILANKEDGEDLAANFGPYRLIVPGDKKPARSAMRVVAIDVLTAKKP